MNLKTVLFDVGGTLVKYQPPSKAAKKFTEHTEETGADKNILRELAHEYILLRDAGIKNLQEATFTEAIDRVQKNLDLEINPEEKEKILHALYYIFFGSIAQLYKGADDLLSYLNKRSLNIGLISNTPWPGVWHEYDLNRFGILPYFKLKIWTSDEGIRKPHPDLFKKALGHFDTKPDEAVYVGDKFDRDVEGANGVNMSAIWINSLKTDKDLKFNGWKVDNLEQVLGIVKSLTGD